jgi:hypothetical protein
MPSAEIPGPTLEERRRVLAGRLLDEARSLMDEMHQPHTIKGFSAGKVLRYSMDEPPVDVKKNLMIAAAIAIDKHLKLEQFDDKDRSGYAMVDAFFDRIVGDRPAQME